MEVGAVKQAFNNEVILLKKKLNQAKIQIIHKLTRKAKTLTEKKAPEKLKEKFNKKAESAVKEVLIIKKIKARDVARFIVTHKGKLNEYLNKPTVDKDKACARLLLHKALQDKYKVLRERFSNISIEDLLMSRQERLKRKKEAREKQKNKKKGKEENGPVQAEGDWSVEDIDTDGIQVRNESDESDDDEEFAEKPVDDSDIDEAAPCDDSEIDEPVPSDDSEIVKPVPKDDSDIDDDQSDSGDENESDHQENDVDLKVNIKRSKNIPDTVVNHSKEDSSESNDEVQSADRTSDVDDDDESSSGNFIKLTSSLPSRKLGNKNTVSKNSIVNENVSKKKINDKHKDSNKNKNLKNKILMKKFHKDTEETQVQETKIVDPFFITSTGENYMSVAEPRQPDEVKEVHKQGNRQYRRAVMFGHVPKSKPRRNDFGHDKNNSRFNKYDDSNKGNYDRNFKSNGFDKQVQRFNKSDDKSNFKDRRSNDRKTEDASKPEKLHPSWEAKKRQSGILPFQGKKIVFNES